MADTPPPPRPVLDLDMESDDEVDEAAELGLYDLDSLKDGIHGILENLKSPGNFAIFEDLPQAPNPGISIQGSRAIGLPLSDHDANTMINLARRTSGHGDGVNDCHQVWELPPSDFRTTNPAWTELLKTVTTRICDGLGINPLSEGIQAQLRSLTVYEEDSSLPAHLQPGNKPRHFGTLEISLPSYNTGGEVHVGHRDRNQVFDPSKNCEFGYSFIASFSDVFHKVKPVSAGKRLLLTYDLLHTRDCMTKSAGNSTTEISNLKTMLTWWNDPLSFTAFPASRPKTLAYMLQCQYSGSNLRRSSLTGHDKKIASLLADACANTGFYFCLAELELTVSGACEDDEYDSEDDPSQRTYYITEEFERNITLTEVRDPDGSLAATQHRYSEQDFMLEDPFEDLEPESQKFHDVGGNGEAVHVFRCTVAIIMPATNKMEFFFGPSKANYAIDQSSEPSYRALFWLYRLRDKYQVTLDEVLRRAITDEFRQLSCVVIDYMQKWSDRPKAQLKSPQPFSDNILTQILLEAVKLGDKTTFSEIFEFCSGKLCMSMYTDIGKAFGRFHLLTLLPAVSHQVSKFSSFERRYEALRRFSEGMDAAASQYSYDPAPVQDWCDLQVEFLVASMEHRYGQDGATLAVVARRLPSLVLSRVRRQTNRLAMLIAFVVESRGLNLSEDEVVIDQQTVFDEFIPYIVRSFNLESIGVEQRTHGLPSTENSRNARSIALLLRKCHSASRHFELRTIIQAMCRQARSIDTSYFAEILLPCLNILVRLFHVELAVGHQLGQFRLLFQVIFGYYVTRHVGQEVPKSDWACSEVGCGCSDCLQLDRFLQSRSQITYKFRASRATRHHLHVVLNGSDEIQNHESEAYSGSTATLVVKKKPKAQQELYSMWVKTCQTARDWFDDFGHESLRGLLEEFADPVLNLDVPGLAPLLAAQAPAIDDGLSSDALPRAPHVLPPISRRRAPGNLIVVE